MSMNAATSQPSRWDRHVHNFDIDNYLNRFIPRPRTYILPKPIAHFLGYRPPNAASKPAPSNPVQWLSALVGGFIGIALITAVHHSLPMLGGQQVPIVIASFGAAAVLEYNTIESPLAQPRNLIVGHLLSAFVGVAITKCFERLPAERFTELQWVAGSLSVGVASAVMSITKTVHPPAGATALLASSSDEIRVLGWWLLPLVLLASVLMSASALIVNNLTRQWPIYWWTPVDLSKKKDAVLHVRDVEKPLHSDRLSIQSESTQASHVKSPQHLESSESGRRLDTTLDRNDANATEDPVIDQHTPVAELSVVIRPDSIVLPDWMEVDEWETQVLQTFRQKLQNRHQR